MCGFTGTKRQIIQIAKNSAFITELSDEKGLSNFAYRSVNTVNLFLLISNQAKTANETCLNTCDSFYHFLGLFSLLPYKNLIFSLILQTVFCLFLEYFYHKFCKNGTQIHELVDIIEWFPENIPLKSAKREAKVQTKMPQEMHWEVKKFTELVIKSTHYYLTK